MANPSKMNSLTKRTITALILVPFVLSVLIVGNPMFEICVVLLGFLLAWEWANMIPSKNKDLYLASYSFAVVVLVEYPKIWGFIIVALITAFVFIKARKEKKRFLLTLGVPYISIGLACLCWIYQDVGILFFLWVLFVVWGMDTGGYMVGSTLKGPKLMPKVSPNKTISGLIGGLVFAVLAGSLVVWYVESTYADVALNYISDKEYLFIFKGVYVIMGLLAMLFGFISQMGDLVESAIKRNVGVKDTSGLIPGHGGVFDRIDALIFVAPFVYLWFKM
ncbi:MAG: phosphatidate cytidylyltransferase [Lactobacillaceae bacterium]|jgi:phosphatidate cytidylyltransferase|nr:phosphatidate cytidylyltransferase [Lactobacillaceae bacterium]